MWQQQTDWRASFNGACFPQFEFVFIEGASRCQVLGVDANKMWTINLAAWHVQQIGMAPMWAVAQGAVGLPTGMRPCPRLLPGLSAISLWLWGDSSLLSWSLWLQFLEDPSGLSRQTWRLALFFPQLLLQLKILKFFYCYSITVVCIFSPSLHPTPSLKSYFIFFCRHYCRGPHSFTHLHPAPNLLPSGCHHTVVCVHELSIFVLKIWT